MTDIVVRDNPDQQRFEVTVGGEFAGFADYRKTEDEIIFPHVEVDPRFRGHGVAGELVRFALDNVREDGTRRIVPMCPYVQTFLRRYPQYQDLVAGAR